MNDSNSLLIRYVIVRYGLFPSLIVSATRDFILRSDFCFEAGNEKKRLGLGVLKSKNQAAIEVRSLLSYFSYRKSTSD